MTLRLSRAALLLLGAGLLLGMTLAGVGRAVLQVVRGATSTGQTSISHAVVISRMEAVSKLVTSETTIRDVVVYQNTRLGSTKRSLVVVTGKAMVGLDLAKSRGIDIDEQARRIAIKVPHAELLGIDIMDLKTYDESRGLWNPFHPADRDTVLQLARQRLQHAAVDLAVREHAEESARRLLKGLFAADGYTVDVQFEPFLALPPAQ